MKSIILIFSIFLLASCVTQKQRARICNECSVTDHSKDSIVEKVVHDTIIIPSIAGPVQYLENPCKNLCDSLGNLKPFIKTEKKNGITSIIKVVGNSLAINCDADSLRVVVAHLEKQSFQKREKNFVKYLKCDKDHRTKFDGFTFWFFWAVASFYSIKYAIKAVRTYFHV